MNRLWPIDPADTEAVVHAICPYLRRAVAECRRCPAWETDPHHGPVKSGCRTAAENVVSIVRHGTPFVWDGVAS